MAKTESSTDLMANEGKDFTSPGPRGLYRPVVHHRAGRQDLPAARPAVCQPLPRRLVRAAELKSQVQGEIRLRPGVPGELRSAYEDIAKFFSEDVKEIDVAHL